MKSQVCSRSSSRKVDTHVLVSLHTNSSTIDSTCSSATQRAFPPSHAVQERQLFEGGKDNRMLTLLSHAFGDSPPLPEVTLPVHTSLEDSVKKLEWFPSLPMLQKTYPSAFCVTP